MPYGEGLPAQIPFRGQQFSAEDEAITASSMPAAQEGALQPPVLHYPMEFNDTVMSWTPAPPSQFPVNTSAAGTPAVTLPVDLSTANPGLAATSHSEPDPSPSTMAVSAADQSRSQGPLKKRIAQSACETCRRKRTKCVIEPGHIECSVCRSLRIPCLFSGIDKRKESVRVLRSRLARLETIVGKMMTADQREAEHLLSKLRHGEGDTDSLDMADILATSAVGLSSNTAGNRSPQDPKEQQLQSPLSKDSEPDSDAFGHRPMPPPKLERTDSDIMKTGAEAPQERMLRLPSDDRNSAIKDVAQGSNSNQAAPAPTGSGNDHSAIAVEDTLTELTDR